jgi:omega-3 fatty acid desaturase (delta-15 desaturase)
LNRWIGEFLHTIILVPFYAWKLTHRHHHRYTGHIDKDEIFYPIREKEVRPSWFPKAPQFGFTLGFGWFIYLIYGFHPRTVSHIIPVSEIFEGLRHQVVVSVGILFAWLLAVIKLSDSWVSLVTFYLIPVVVFGSWLVVTTFLHHQDDGVEWYGEEYWNYVVGNLSSIDRHYGIFHGLVHNIGTHQLHHLFPAIPHYNLEEATAAFRTKFPELVKNRSENHIIPEFIAACKRYAKESTIDNNTQYFKYSEQKNKQE